MATSDIAKAIVAELATATDGTLTYGSTSIDGATGVQTINTGTVAAAGSTAATATVLTKPGANVTGADGVKGVKLPAATQGALFFLSNVDVTYTLKVYPATGEAMSSVCTGDLAANIPILVAPGATAIFFCGAAGVWRAMVGVPWYGHNTAMTFGTGRVACGVAAPQAIDLVDSKLLNFGTGTDVAVNGVFSADTDWTKGAGWTIAGGVAVATGAISTDLTATAAPLTSGRIYKVTYTITQALGTITATCGTQAGTARSATGTYSEYITANDTGFKFATSGFTGTVDDVSIVLADVAVLWNGTLLQVIVDGAVDFTIAANVLTALAGSTIKTNTLAETTAGAGVTCSNAFQAHGNAAVTATTGGGGTGLIPVGASFVTVTSDNADKQISLPAGTIGDVIKIQIGGTGCELIAVTAGDKVNNVVVGATNELALAANCTYICEYVAANDWRVHGYTLAGAPLGATTAALTTISIADAEGTPDYALSGTTTTLPYGLATQQEAVTLMYVIKNLQERVAQLETGAKLIPDAL